MSLRSSARSLGRAPFPRVLGSLFLASFAACGCTLPLDLPDPDHADCVNEAKQNHEDPHALCDPHPFMKIPDPPPCMPACTVGQTACDGDVPRVCEANAGCAGWKQGPPCGPAGATCAGGACVFAQPCPHDTDTFCYDDGHVLACDGEKVVSFTSCSSGLHCRENTLESGRTIALCATDGDLCASEDWKSEECRDGAVLECMLGLPIESVECASGTCVTNDANDAVWPVTCGS